MIASRRAWIHRALLAAAATSLALAAGCSLTRPAPVKESFVLEPPTPPAVAKPQPGMLRVGTITVGAPFRGRSFVFRESELKFETDYYHEFLVAPSANIGEATARALAAANTFASVVPAGVIADPDWVLEGFVDALYGDARDVSKPFAVLTITYYLRRGTGTRGFRCGRASTSAGWRSRPAAPAPMPPRSTPRSARSWPNCRATSRL